jgi:pimeloyl-[acyl-carrier protein] methyl ester esterase
MTFLLGLPIILLPGMTGTADLLAELSDALAPHREVHAISYPLTGPQDYEHLTGYVLDRLPTRPFIILGESFSGPIALEIAVREPGRTAGLIMAATFASHPLPTAVTSLTSWMDLSLVPQMIIESFMLGPYGTPELKSHFFRAINAMPSDTLRARTEQTLSVDKRHLLAMVGCPTLSLTGRHDRLIPTNCGHEIEAGIAGCLSHAIEGPHMFLETHPRLSAAAIDTFCREVEAAVAMATTGPQRAGHVVSV